MVYKYSINYRQVRKVLRKVLEVTDRKSCTLSQNDKIMKYPEKITIMTSEEYKMICTTNYVAKCYDFILRKAIMYGYLNHNNILLLLIYLVWARRRSLIRILRTTMEKKGEESEKFKASANFSIFWSESKSIISVNVIIN